MKPVFLAALVISAIGCATDLRSRRIPNVLTFGTALGALLFHALTDGTSGAVTAGAGWMTGVALMFVPFALGGMGGGDIKLVAALGAWVGPLDAVWLVLYSGVAGGVLALIVAVRRRYLRAALRNMWLLLVHWRTVGLHSKYEISLAGGTGPRLAYAVPILIGTVVTVWLR